MFLILYAVLCTYFAGVMVRPISLTLSLPIIDSQVRLILTLTPIIVVLASIGFSHLLKTYYNIAAG